MANETLPLLDGVGALREEVLCHFGVRSWKKDQLHAWLKCRNAIVLGRRGDDHSLQCGLLGSLRRRELSIAIEPYAVWHDAHRFGADGELQHAIAVTLQRACARELHFGKGVVGAFV